MSVSCADRYDLTCRSKSKKTWTPSLPDADEVNDIIHASRQKRKK
ncbi:hypothetical protein [Thalassotalea sp. G20_0]|nr:hypothetical protein [Thalassotalea sp. G20_0]